MNNPETLDLLLKRIKDLPTLPTVLHKIMQLTADEFTSAQDLVEVINADQSLTANLLKVANSPIYGVPKRIESVRQAVVLLGFPEVRNVALSASVFSSLKRTSGSTVFNRDRFWAHSYLVAYLTRELYERPNSLHQAAFFTAGLLHDVGKVVLDQYLPQEFTIIAETIRNKKTDSYYAETEVLGVTHAEIGGRLLQRWQLPPEQAFAVAAHHRPWTVSADNQLATALYYANLITHVLGYSSFDDEPPVSLDSFYNSEDARLLAANGQLLPCDILAQKVAKLQKNREWLADALRQSALL